MAIEVATKDTTALSDAELEEIANLCMEGPAKYDIGLISKEQEKWVLVSQARDGNKLHGFAFFTMERIGGTPSYLIGISSVRRTTKRETVLRAMMAEGYRRAILAFPDEDVLVGTRLFSPSGFQAYANLIDIVPQRDHRVTGEERQWIRRLAKRFGVENQLDDRTFIVTGDGATQPGLDIEAIKPDVFDEPYAEFFAGVDAKNGDALIGFGWAMAEYLTKFSPGSKA